MVSKVDEYEKIPRGKSLAAVLFRTDTNPVIQRALRALAESSARDIKETSEKVIIYKPTYQYCADNERLKWKLDLAEARLRRKEREAQLVTSDFEEERSLFEEKRSKRKNSKKNSQQLAALERIERRLSTVQKALPEKKYITQLNTSLERTLPTNYGEPIELAKVSTNPPGPRIHESRITIVPNYRAKSRGRERSRSRNSKSALESSVERLRAPSERSSRLSRAESEAIAEKNIEIGSLKEHIRTLQNQISQTQSMRSIALSSSSVFVDDEMPALKNSVTKVKSSSQTSLMKHLDELQYENESLNNTVRELRDRLMLHSQADDSAEENEEAVMVKSEYSSAEEKAKSNPSSYAAPFYPTSNIFHTH